MTSAGQLPPLPPGRLIGRDRDLEAVDERFEAEERLVTVTGPGGIGKSRLAAEVARRCLAEAEEEGESSCWLCDLSEAADLESVLDVVAAALALPDSPEEPGGAAPAERIGRALAGRGPALLVLDDLDQVAREAGEAVSAWLAAAPEARLLVTSRERLHLPGEVVYELAPLELPGAVPAVESDAFQLFVSCGRRIRSGWEPSDAEAPFVAEIVQLLEGIPLAIELAAARMAVMGPRALLHRLRSGFELLRRKERGPARHATLSDTIDWSWRLLQPWEQDALAQCSTFRGGFSLEAAEAVLSLEGHEGAPDVLDVVQALRDKSLLHAGEVRLLPGELRLGTYAAVRGYAAAKLAESEEADATEARHAAYFVEAGERWSAESETDDGRDPRRHLLVERENLLAVAERVLGRGPVTAATAEPALKALLVLWPVLLVQGPLATYAKLVGPVLDISAGSGADPSLQADALAVRGSLRWHRGQSQEGLGNLLRALAIARKLDNRRLEGRVSVHLGKALADRGELDEARKHYDGALAIHRELREEAEEGRALAMVGQVEARRGRYDEARRLYERALAIHGRVGDALLEALDRRLLGELLLALGQREEAHSCLDSSLEAARRLGDHRGEAVARGLLALLHHDAGEGRRARRAYEEVVDDLRRLGFRRLEGVFTGYLGVLERERGRRVEAYTLLERSVDLVADDDADHRSLFLAHLGGLEADAGRAAEAEALLDGASSGSAPGATAPFVDAIALQRSHLRRRGAEAAIRKAEATTAATSVHVRLALRCLREALDRGSEPAAAMPMEDSLIVGGGAQWFRPPGGERVSLKQRRNLRLLLERVVRERLDAPGKALTWEDLLGAGWPRERVIPSAGAHRVRVAVSTLRKLGLRDVFLTVSEGYRLDPSVDVHLLDEDDGR